MESEGEGGFLRGSRDGGQKSFEFAAGEFTRKGTKNSRRKKKVLSEPNVKVVFHQTAVPVTPLFLLYIQKGPLLAIPHAATQRRGYLKWILSFLVDAEPAAPLTKKGADAAATWTPSFLLLPALSRAENKKGRQSPQAAIPIGLRAERGEGPAIIPPRSKKRVPFR